MSTPTENGGPAKNPLKEIAQPFIDLVHAPRALWGVNLAYVIEGMVYFGMLGYLAMYFNDYIGLNDIDAGRMVGVLTAGITIAMFFLGSVADKKGVRFALLAAFALMILGRGLLSAAPLIDPSHVNLVADDVAAYDPVVLFTEYKPPVKLDAETVADVLPAAAGGAPQAAIPPEGREAIESVEPDDPVAPIPQETPATMPTALPVAPAAAATTQEATSTTQPPEARSPGYGSTAHIIAMVGIIVIVFGYGMYQPGAYAAVRQFTTPATAAMGFAMLYALMNLGGWLPSFFGPMRKQIGINGAYWFLTDCTILALLATFVILSRRTVARATADAQAARAAAKPAAAATATTEEAQPPGSKPSFSLLGYIRNHPLADPKFSFFIFALIPVQTLFAHNWLTLPMYVERAFAGSVIGEYFEFAVNLNPLLIFIFVPIVTALTQKAKVYNMMIIGTFIMAAPTFLLALDATPFTLFGYLLIMTIGEAMWQPRFLQYAAEIAPEGRTGQYMGVAQLPWFLTKMLVPLYSGWFLLQYVPEKGAQNSEFMWLVYACIAMLSTILLISARGWIGKDFKTKAA